MEANSAPPDLNRRSLVVTLVAGGIFMLVAGIIAGVAVGEIYFLICLAALIDFGLAFLVSKQRVDTGTSAQPVTGPEPLDPDHVAGQATEDPSFNPSDPAYDPDAPAHPEDPDYNPHARED